MDRRASSPIISPKPDNPEPMSKGNTEERTVATPAPKGPETPDPNAGAASKSTSQMSAIDLRAAADSTPGSGMLGQALRNFGRYTQGSSFDNPNGGQDNESRPEISFDTKGVEFGPWLERFVRMVKHNWLVPQAAMTMAGHVVIRLNIHKGGALTDIEVVEPSSIASFNTAAVNALRTSNPGIPLPTEYPVDPMAMTVIFYYNEKIR
jgi:TonB family protein